MNRAIEVLGFSRDVERALASKSLPEPSHGTWLSPDGLTLSRAHAGAAADVAAFERAAMSIAWAQAGGLAQSAFFMWMLGATVSIWTLFFLATMGAAPFRAILNLRGAFASVDVPGVSLGAAKALYVAIHVAGAAMLFWRVRSMGLIPLTSADWVWLLPGRSPVESSAAAQRAFA
jgi:hypothetical protein